MPPHAPFVHWSLLVQALPSLHAVPLATLDHVLVDALGVQAWQVFVGLMAADA